jgi:hypothetical protein
MAIVAIVHRGNRASDNLTLVSHQERFECAILTIRALPSQQWQVHLDARRPSHGAIRVDSIGKENELS